MYYSRATDKEMEVQRCEMSYLADEYVAVWGLESQI